MLKTTKLYIVFSENDSSNAGELVSFLKEKGCVFVAGQTGQFVLETDKEVKENSAVIFVSDTAVASPEWQQSVRNLPNGLRIVPVGSLENADYDNPEVVPREIEAINFIAPDKQMYANIWETLTIEPDFYSIRNDVLSYMTAWKFAKESDVFLMNDYKTIIRSKKAICQKLSNETDDYFKQQLTEMLQYLTVSQKAVIAQLIKNIRQWVKAGAVALMLTLCIVLFAVILPTAKRAYNATVALSAQASNNLAPVNAVKMLDALDNPMVSSTLKPEIYTKFVDYTSQNWQNTPVSNGYKWALNDGCICQDERYIITANGNGHVTVWDTYDGSITEESKVSDSPLSGVTQTEDGAMTLVTDSEGYVYFRVKDGEWKKSEQKYDIPFNNSVSLCCDNALAAINTGSAILVFNVNDKRLSFGNRFAYEKVFCLEIENGIIHAAVEENGVTYCITIEKSQIIVKTKLPCETYMHSQIAVRNNRYLFADNTGAVATFFPDKAGTIEYAGTTLSVPVNLCFLNDDTIVYYDRDTGIFLYDIKHRLPLDRVLTFLSVGDRLCARGNTVMAYEKNLYSTENVSALLPQEPPQEGEVLSVHSGLTDASDGIIKKLDIKKAHLVVMEMQINGANDTVIIDASKRYFIGDAQKDETLIKGIDEYRTYSFLSFYTEGEITAAGLEENGSVALFACSDGKFFEMYVDENGGNLITAKRQLPNRSPIVSITGTADGYFLEDKAGNYWFIRSGRDIVTSDGRIRMVKNKLHFAMDNDIKDIASKNTVKKLDVKFIPGRDGKEWD